jgi:hypothetical protein
MKTITNDLVTTIAGFYAEMYGEKIGTCDYTSEMLSVFDQLHQRAFPGHLFDSVQFLAQAKTQLFGNELAVRNYYTVSFRFAPLSGEGKQLVIRMGATSAPGKPHGTLGIWTEDQAINDTIQSVLKEVAPEDAEDQAGGLRGLWNRVCRAFSEMVSRGRTPSPNALR